ncbi:unnamed protein product [Nyctereutes procyonoides]|uniref:(raccoon dog) hypothetical protein n=1 Tax=Nyctereutes procyonoides TaxID=34880 RepID=A0A811YF02_NYCPR|nr:unnamed protein product [Nyctereutes procyonoides]
MAPDTQGAEGNGWCSAPPLEILFFLNRWYYATPFLAGILHISGNGCQLKMPLGVSMALTFPSAMMASYYLLLQTNISLFCVSELLLEVLTLTTLSSTTCDPAPDRIWGSGA